MRIGQKTTPSTGKTLGALDNVGIEARSDAGANSRAKRRALRHKNSFNRDAGHIREKLGEEYAFRHSTRQSKRFERLVLRRFLQQFNIAPRRESQSFDNCSRHMTPARWILGHQHW